MPIADQTAPARPWARVLLTAVYGAAAVGLPYLLAGVRPSLPNTVAGGTLLVCGLLLLDGGDRHLGRLVTFGGAAWFLPDLAPVLSGSMRSAIDATSLLYLGFLSHAAATVCDRRLVRLAPRLATLVGYGVALTAATALAEPGLALLGTSLVAMAADTGRRTGSAPLGARWLGPLIALVLAAGLLVPAGLRWASSPLTEPTLSRILVLAVTSLAVLCLAASDELPCTRGAITFDANASAALAAEIGNLSGQGPVGVVFRSPDDGPWIDFAGLALDVDDTSLTLVGEPGAPLAGLLTRTTVPSLLADDLTHLLRLAGDHARLNYLVRQRTAAIASSRRRLVESGDDERLRLESALRQGAGASLDLAIATIPEGPGLAALTERARATRAGLDAIARGIDPLGDRGLRESLEALAERAGVPVSVSVTHETPPHLARTIWFVCSEAVANVEKHAPHARVRITVDARADPVRVAITDDGPGGANQAGHGLRGLADRASALGGRLTVTSTDEGTRIDLVVPRGGHP